MKNTYLYVSYQTSKTEKVYFIDGNFFLIASKRSSLNVFCFFSGDCTTGCDATGKYLDQFEEVVKYSLPKGPSLAAFFAESIQVTISSNFFFNGDFILKLVRLTIKLHRV